MFTVNKFVLQNTSHQKFRSFIFFFLICIASICLFGTGIFTENMQSGVEQASVRIGADLIVVPSAYGDTAKEALFHGEACTILFQENPVDSIAKIEGVKQASAQLYLKTLPLSCCASGGVQIIAFDPATDFTIAPWIRENGIKTLGKDEIIAGSSSGLKVNDKIGFFGHNFTVADVLEETGMGYDKSVFVSYEAANQITALPEYKDIFGEKTERASMILVDTENGYDLDTVRNSITNQISSSISVYEADELVQMLTKQLYYFKRFGVIISAFVILLAAVSLFSLVTITFHQRRNHVGSLLSVGVGRKKILEVFLTEYFYLMLAGTAAGILLVSIVVFPLHTVIKNVLEMPYKFIGIDKTLLLILKTILINFGMLLLAASLSFFKILKYEPSILAEVQS